MAAATSFPLLMDPANRIVLLKNFLISLTNAIGLIIPACPPAPAATKINPSTFASAAFSACRFL